MDRSMVNRLSAGNADRVLKALTAQQHIRPSAELGEAVANVCDEEGFPLSTGMDALSGFDAAPAVRVGRLSRKQICAMAQRIESAWQADLARRLRQEAPEPA